MHARLLIIVAAGVGLSGCLMEEMDTSTEDQALILGPVGTSGTIDTKIPLPAPKPIGPAPWVARHGMTSSEYQSAFNQFVGRGYRLTHVSGYDVDGTVRFAAIWEKISGPAWVARHNLTSSQYQSQFDYWVSKGYRLTVVDGYEAGGQARYAAIWEKKTGPAWVARHGMTSAQYQSQFNYWVSKGYRLSSVQGYGVGNTDYYAAIWEKTTGPAWVARHGMTSAQYQSYFDSYVGQGYRLAHVSGYQVGSADRYAAIWEKTAGPAWIARHRMTSGSYQHDFTDFYLRGYRLQQVDGYALGNGARYAAIWRAEATAKTGNYCKSGQCFDLGVFADEIEDAVDPAITKWGFEVRRGLSVIQRADGPGRTAADWPMTDFTVHNRFNPASVSKTITAVAMLQLLDEHGIDVDTPIHGYLPQHWSIPANNQTITFAEVLNHSSGLRNADAGGYQYQHMQTLMAHEIDLADKVPSYANANYALLRILVASLDGYTNWIWNGDGSAAHFIDYVNDEIFAPLGIYDVAYKATGAAPTLFYPNPPGSASGTAYGDWTLQPGSAGGHNSIHELALFGLATFSGTLLPHDVVAELKAEGLGFGHYGTYADGTQCYGKGGFFPGSWNGGAELSTVLVYCDNGLTTMLMINGEMSAKGVFQNALNAAFTPQ